MWLLEDGDDLDLYCIGAEASRAGEDKRGWHDASRLWLNSEIRVFMILLTMPLRSVEGGSSFTE